MSLRQLERAWNDLGELDPFWAITGDPRYKFGRWDVDEFLATGEAPVARLMEVGAEFARPVGRASVLDFGCGLGRLCPAFLQRFESYVGVDISQSLIDEARAMHATRSRCTFAVNTEPDLRAFPSASFDLTYCWEVLQHVPSRHMVKSYIAELVRVTRPDGLLVFQTFSYIDLLYRLQPRRRLYALLRGLSVSKRVLYERLRLYPNEANFIPESEVVACVRASGAEVRRAEVVSAPGAPHRSTTYYVTRG